LNAVITMLEPAAGLGGGGGPLEGVPVAVKDNIDVRGAVTTNASLVGRRPPAMEDATVVARLRNAGAELLCKTNLLEYAAGSVSPAFGMTFNPHDPRRTSGGSSGGSAALVGAGVCDYALGTDTGGSIRVPAAYCGVVGLKPTAGQISLDGIFPLSRTLDQVGPLTRTVDQAAALLAVIAGRPYRIRAVDGVRLGVLRQQLDDEALTPGVRACVERAVDRMKDAGYQVADVEVPALDMVDGTLAAIVMKEAFEVHRDLLEREGDAYGPGPRALLEAGRDVSDAAYEHALANRRTVAVALEQVFERIDILAGPTVAFVAPDEDPPVGTPQGAIEGRFTGLYSVAGLPAVSLPCGRGEDELPVGLQLAAAGGADEFLLSVAADYERLSRN
jgi:aspartyl-tRNA(Asn)/glutamyl-tRNA(Gln) amidotransferase subunit A